MNFLTVLIVAATAFAEESNKDAIANAERSYYASIEEDII
jgi:hypothetical protein